MQDEGRSEDAERIGAETVATVYRTVVFGVVAAAGAAALLTAMMIGLGFAAVGPGAIFVTYISSCALAHVVLALLYRRQAGTAPDWRRWGLVFTIVAFLEGVGWGWSPIGLTSGSVDAEYVCLLVNLGVAGCSIPAFSPFLPAFLAFFLPSILPYAIHSASHQEPLHAVTTALAFLYTVGLGTFGVLLNRSFRRQIALRFRAEGLADALKQQVAAAETANRAKSTFLASASHDLRQPVHALSLFVGALRGLPMKPDAVDIIEHIERSTQALDDLFAALLDISKLDAGVVEVDRRPFALAPMLERICRENAGSAREKGLRLKLRAGRRPVVVDSDPVLVERILRNLVSNAVRYTSTGRVLVACRPAAGGVRVEVWDTGPGIPPGERETIFQEYYQLGNPERDRAKGLGLGLAIVKRLASLLDCNLTLRSTVGRGSVFAITMAASKATARVDEMPTERLAESLQGRLIVVVDDEAEIRAGMATVLRRWGHDVVAAGSGPEALAALADRPAAPDLIIADFRLRHSETGLDVVETLRSEYNAKIPAILVTGDTAPARLAEARRSGLPLLHKPVSNSRLRAVIANTLLVAPAA